MRGGPRTRARPWLGTNAIHGAIAGARRRSRLPRRTTSTIDGLVFREVVNVTTIEGGLAGNVVPDRVGATVNFRYAPDARARARPRRGCGLIASTGAELEVIGNAPPGPVVVRNPLVERLAACGRPRGRPKQAWTPVAEFATIGRGRRELRPGRPAVRSSGRRTGRGRGARARSYRVLRAFLAAGRRGKAEMHLSPGMRDVEPYPVRGARPAQAGGAGRRPRADRLRRGRPARRDAGVHPRGARGGGRPDSSYPRAAGLPELREAIAAWVERRFGVDARPATRLILPTLGAKELVFSLAQAVLDPAIGPGPRRW